MGWYCAYLKSYFQVANPTSYAFSPLVQTDEVKITVCFTRTKVQLVINKEALCIVKKGRLCSPLTDKEPTTFTGLSTYTCAPRNKEGVLLLFMQL